MSRLGRKREPAGGTIQTAGQARRRKVRRMVVGRVVVATVERMAVERMAAERMAVERMAVERRMAATTAKKSGFHVTRLERERLGVELRSSQKGFGWMEKVMGTRGQMRRVTMNWYVSYCPVCKLACLMQWNHLPSRLLKWGGPGG